MFSAITRMVHSPVNWYSSGPSQKYMLRQIKAMDFALVDEQSQKLHFIDKGSYSAVDEKGELVINDDLNIALLMLYGHILYSSGSFFHALSKFYGCDRNHTYWFQTDYFLRAFALDPGNAMINLNIGLAYVHQSLKRQAENRQHLILQGTTFLFTYYEARKLSSRVEERQEAHYNVARVYHMLGLTSLAIPYYDKVFEEIADGEEGREDLVVEAAYNISNIYSMAGNVALAHAVTRKWLVI
jgi:general transcription factor 3C polypeptide 3 (transcription factor C subunit 4)